MMKRQYLNIFAKQQQNIKKYLSRLVPLAFFYILLYRVETVRKFCKAVILYLIEAKLLPVSVEFTCAPEFKISSQLANIWNNYGMKVVS